MGAVQPKFGERREKEQTVWGEGRGKERGEASYSAGSQGEGDGQLGLSRFLTP